MYTTQHRQEALSVAYIHAVAANCGCVCSARDFDYGVDVSLHYVEHTDDGYLETGESLRIQAKSTVNYRRRPDGSISYDLQASAYNKLVREDRGTPIVLVLFCMPTEETGWLSIDTERLQLQHCAYWLSLRGQEPTDNSATIQISIPSDNVFDCAALEGIFERLRAGGLP